MRLKHNKDVMSNDGIFVLNLIKDFLTEQKSSLNKYCKEKNILVSSLTNKLYRETLTLDDIIEIVSYFNYGVYLENENNNLIEVKKTDSKTMFFKDVIILTKQLNCEIKINKKPQ